MKKQVRHPSVLEVWLHQVRVGTITNLANDRNIFIFAQEYVQHRQRPVLSLGFYDADAELLDRPEQVQTKVPPFFSNLLPEGRLREYLAERGGVKEAREFPLLWLLGGDLPGAVWVQDIDGHPLPPRTADAGMKAGRGWSENEREPALRFSLAGIQLKFSAVGTARQLAIPAEGRGGSWIVKLPSSHYPLLPENEYSVMTLARAVGLDVADAGLVPVRDIEGLPSQFAELPGNALGVRRFDRTPESGKIHIEDFNQVYRQFPAAKYKNFSYGNMAADLWRTGGERDLREFVARLVFNAAIGNHDMHLKNWSLIYRDGRTPHLSPAYDLVSTICYIEDRKMALSLAREKDTGHLDVELLERFSARALLPGRLVSETALATAELLVNRWSEMKADLPLTAAMRQKIEGQFAYVPIIRRILRGAAARKRAPSQRKPRRNGNRSTNKK
jgi:serine/threonine-protein kinase HipA